mmetsp:Transcript_7178/g.16459  ORF Transcript_7178/g.16459 Transcript_7178/m.16459 type:complete len:216 (-) Transcript_7178:292-939(-)
MLGATSKTPLYTFKAGITFLISGLSFRSEANPPCRGMTRSSPPTKSSKSRSTPSVSEMFCDALSSANPSPKRVTWMFSPRRNSDTQSAWVVSMMLVLASVAITRCLCLCPVPMMFSSLSMADATIIPLSRSPPEPPSAAFSISWQTVRSALSNFLETQILSYPLMVSSSAMSLCVTSEPTRTRAPSFFPFWMSLPLYQYERHSFARHSPASPIES